MNMLLPALGIDLMSRGVEASPMPATVFLRDREAADDSSEPFRKVARCWMEGCGSIVAWSASLVVARFGDWSPMASPKKASSAKSKFTMLR
jgi:hypothetical protein